MSAPQRLPFVDIEPLGLVTDDDVARARAYVEARRVICRVCGEDVAGDLRFVYGHVDGRGRLRLRPRHALWDVPVTRLVQAGVSNRRLAIEMAKCVVACRACQCRAFEAVGPRPQMLRCKNGRFDGVVAKGAIASGGGRNRERRTLTRNRIESFSDRALCT